MRHFEPQRSFAGRTLWLAAVDGLLAGVTTDWVTAAIPAP
jgi:hypothetical protein